MATFDSNDPKVWDDSALAGYWDVAVGEYEARSKSYDE